LATTIPAQASDRIVRSVKHFLDVLDELNRAGVEYVSFRENIYTGGPLNRAIIVIIGAIAELKRSLIVERVLAGMRRARVDGQRISQQHSDLKKRYSTSGDRSGSSQ
jgi:DNA invertase Pin-like site-specific DNA recombinase